WESTIRVPGGAKRSGAGGAPVSRAVERIASRVGRTRRPTSPRVDAPLARSYAGPLDGRVAREDPDRSDASRVTASEFAFLAMGLVLGVAAGAALIEGLRARPPVRREVKVTVAQDAIPRRASTLADDAFVSTSAEPARGGPAARRDGGHPTPGSTPDRR